MPCRLVPVLTEIAHEPQQLLGEKTLPFAYSFELPVTVALAFTGPSVSSSPIAPKVSIENIYASYFSLSVEIQKSVRIYSIGIMIKHGYAGWNNPVP